MKKKLMLLVAGLALASLGCQTKTAKGPEPGPVADAAPAPETQPDDVWTDDEPEDSAVAGAPQDEEPEPAYDDEDDYDYEAPPPDDDSYADGYGGEDEEG